MLLVHPVHEVVRQLPLLIGSVVLGSATGNSLWSVAALVLLVVFGVARWFTTTYRIDAEQIQRREGVLQRKVLSVPRNRIRSVSTDARLLHRLLGLTVVKVSTGQEAKGDAEFALDAVRSDEVAGLRAILLADSRRPAWPPPTSKQAPRERVLARWQPSWLRYSPLSFTGLAMIAAAVGVVYQTGAVAALEDSRLATARTRRRRAARRRRHRGRGGARRADRLGAAVGRTFAGHVRQPGAVAARRRGRRKECCTSQHGLLRVREHTFDMRRLRGGTIREPLLVRMFGGARLDAVMTGVDGSGEASLLLPPCPVATAEGVLTELIGRSDVVSRRAARPRAGRHPQALDAGPDASRAARGRAGRAWQFVAAVPAMGVDAVRRVDRRWRVPGRRPGPRARPSGGRRLAGRPAGSLDRRRDCISAAGIIGWTVRQTLFQRRAGVATLIAATRCRRQGLPGDSTCPLTWPGRSRRRRHRGWPTMTGLTT